MWTRKYCVKLQRMHIVASILSIVVVGFTGMASFTLSIEDRENTQNENTVFANKYERDQINLAINNAKVLAEEGCILTIEKQDLALSYLYDAKREVGLNNLDTASDNLSKAHQILEGCETNEGDWTSEIYELDETPIFVNHTDSFIGSNDHCTYPNPITHDYSHCNLSGVSFGMVTLLDADFTGANLSGISTDRGAVFYGADFTGANLSDADLFSTTFLEGTDFTGADLTNADLRSTDLNFGADFTDANLSGTDFGGAEIRHIVFADCVGTPIGIPAIGELPICDEIFSNLPIGGNIVFHEDFETYSGWNTIGSGQVMQVSNPGNAISGDNVARKTGNNDPNGAVKQLDKSVDDFEVMLHSKKINTSGGNALSYSIIQTETGSGYGFYLTNTSLVIEERNASNAASPLKTVSERWNLDEWNTFRFIKTGSNLTLEFYKNQVMSSDDVDNVTPTRIITATTNTYSGGFNYAVINGGYDFDTDDYRIWGTAVQ